MAKGILIAAMDFSHVPADEFNDWYDTEHIPERQRVPGFFNPATMDPRREPEAIGRNLRPRQPRSASEHGVSRNCR
jgi:hypothetical protein